MRRGRRTAAPAPDAVPSRSDRRATIAVAVQFAVNGACFASVLPRLPEVRDRVGIGTAAIGALLTVASAWGLASSATCRRVIARYGTRRVLLVGGLATAGALGLVGLSTNWPAALLALGLLVAFDVYVDVAMNLQGSWLSARRRRPIMSRLHGLWSLGSVGGGSVAAWAAASDVPVAVHLGATAVLLAVLSTVLATRLLPVDEVHAAEGPGAASGRADDPGRRRRAVAFFVAGATAIAIEVVALTWSAFRLTDDLGGTASAAALAYVAVVAGMTVARFAGDHLAHVVGAARFTIASAVLAVAALAVAAVVRPEPLVLIAFLVAGFGIATLSPQLYDLAARSGGGTDHSLGVLTAGMRVAAIVAPVAVAALATRSSVGAAIAVVAVAAGMPFLLAVRSLRRDAAHPRLP